LFYCAYDGAAQHCNHYYYADFFIFTIVIVGLELYCRVLPVYNIPLSSDRRRSNVPSGNNNTDRYWSRRLDILVGIDLNKNIITLRSVFIDLLTVDITYYIIYYSINKFLSVGSRVHRSYVEVHRVVESIDQRPRSYTIIICK